MVQDITPTNSQSATNTNTMKPKDISAQSAGSITPTIVSQSNADRRRRNAAEKAARSNQSLAANVERSNVEREYRRLREEEAKANERAEARKAAAKRETVTIYEGGVNSDLKIRRVSIGDYLGGNLRGASEPIETPDELSQYIAITGSGETGNYDAAYRGLEKFRDNVNALLKREAEEKAMIENVRSFATLTGSSRSTPTYTPMTAESVAAHERLIRDPTTDAETRSRLMADLDRDSQYVASHGGASLTATTEKNFSENWYRGGTKQEKEIAQRYLGAVGSTYGKEDFNKSADSIYASQAGKQRDALYQRWDTASRNELLKATDERTKAAIRTNMSVAGLGISSIDAARQKAVSAGDQSNSFAPYAAEKQRQQNAAESRFKSENSKIQQKIADTQNSFNRVNSILRVADEKTDLSSSAFLKEERKTENVYGSDWTSAGGMSAIDAVIRGDKSTTYSDFKAVPAFATEEYILVDAEGKKRYTLRKGDDGGSYAIYSWSGDIVASGKNSKGLKAAFKELNIPYEEQFFNPFKPELSAVAVELSDETDITGINTAAVLKSKTLGTFRGNEEVKAAEVERRTAIQKAQQNAALTELDSVMRSKLGYTLRINDTGKTINFADLQGITPAGVYVRDNAKDNPVIMSSDLTIVRNKDVDNFYDSITGAVNSFKTAVPGPSINDFVFGSSKEKKKETRKEKKYTDFVYSNKDSEMNGLSEWLIGGTEFLKGGIDEINKFSKDTTGKKLFTFEYDDELGWSDVIGGISKPGWEKKLPFIIETTTSTQKPNRFDIDLQRSVIRQTIELPMATGGLVKIADSIKSSYDKGGTESALAATAFWGTQAAEGTIAEAVKNPKKFTIDLAAGVAVGTGVSVATKPIRVAGVTAAKTGAKGVGVINTQFRALETGGYVKSPRSLGIDALINNKFVDVARVERISVFNRFLKNKQYFNKPAHNDPNDLYGGSAEYVQWGSGNAAVGVIQDAGGRVTMDISSGLFLNKGILSPFKNRVLYYKNVRSGMEALSKEDIDEIIKYRDENIEVPHDKQRDYYNKVQAFATSINQPVAFISPKTFNFIGGKNRPRNMELDAENEWALIPPKPAKNNINKATAKSQNKMYWDFPTGSKRFVGFEEKFSTPIFEIDLNPKAAANKRFWMFENARDTIKDTRIGRNGLKPEIYLDSAAKYDAALSKYKDLKTSGELPYNSLDELAYGSHGKEHVGNVAANLFALRAGSQNPELKGASDNLLNAMAHLHDSFKIEDAEMFIPHAKRTEFLIRRGYMDDVVKDQWKLTDKEKKLAARAIGRHTTLQPKISSRIINRPNTLDKALVTADRLDLTRFGVKPDPKKMFVREVLDEPWSWESGMLMPPKPKTGTFDLSKFERVAAKSPYKQKKKSPTVSGRSAYVGSGLAMEGIFGAAYGLNQGRNKEKKKESSKSKADKDGRQTAFNFDKFVNGDTYKKGKNKPSSQYKITYGEKYGKKKYNKTGYYAFGSRYGKGYNYPNGYETPKPYPKSYKSKYGGRYRNEYVIKPYSALEGYKMGYTKKGSYTIGKKYEANPYPNEKTIMHAYSPKTKKPMLESRERYIRGKKGDKTKQKRRMLNLNKLKLENVEIPIVRGEEIFLGKKMKTFERPANKRTIYQFGNVNYFKKPEFTFVLKKRKK